jgi:hypothetical protein
MYPHSAQQKFKKRLVLWWFPAWQRRKTCKQTIPPSK